MKKKIVGIVIFMLVATTVVSATNNINVKENNQQKTCSVDVPVYKVGDSWTYNYHRIEYWYNGATPWYKQYYNCSFTTTVTDDTGANYTFKLTSTNNEGRVTIGSFQLKYTKWTKLTCNMIERKSDLGELTETDQLKGPVLWLIGGKLPFPAQYQWSGTWIFTPACLGLPFPFSAGSNGTIPGYTETVMEKCTLYWGLITLFNNPSKPYHINALPYHCKMTNVTVPAGTYNAYNVSVDVPHYSSWNYYDPNVGMDVKYYMHSTTDTGALQYNIVNELVSTTHTP